MKRRKGRKIANFTDFFSLLMIDYGFGIDKINIYILRKLSICIFLSKFVY